MGIGERAMVGGSATCPLPLAELSDDVIGRFPITGEIARKREITTATRKLLQDFSVLDSMGKILNLVKWGLTLGCEPQDFLGARWIAPFLRSLPANSQRRWALRILNMSPHYFIDGDNPEFEGMPLDEYLEKTFEIIAESRRELYEKLFSNYLQKDFRVMEYGCGPGFLAKAVAPHVATLYACDISTGALVCAEIINNRNNIHYLRADENRLPMVENESLDVIISFALTQHLRDEIFEIVLENCHRKLKVGGKAVFHIQLQDAVWKTEDDWKADISLKGMLKFKYGLHCFGRSMQTHEELFMKHGFAVEEARSLLFLNRDNSSGVDSKYLIVAERL